MIQIYIIILSQFFTSYHISGTTERCFRIDYQAIILPEIDSFTKTNSFGRHDAKNLPEKITSRL